MSEWTSTREGRNALDALGNADLVDDRGLRNYARALVRLPGAGQDGDDGRAEGSAWEISGDDHGMCRLPHAGDVLRRPGHDAHALGQRTGLARAVGRALRAQPDA